MYQFREVSSRMDLLHQKVRNRVIRFSAENALIKTEAYKKFGRAVPAIRRPKIVHEVCEKMTLRVEDEDIIVSNLSPYFCGCNINPQAGGKHWAIACVERGEWTLQEDGLYHNPESDELRYCIAPEDVEAIRSVADYWSDKTMTSISAAWRPDDWDELARLRCTHAGGVNMSIGQGGHSTPGFHKLVTTGFGAVRKQAEDWIRENKLCLFGDKMDKYIFYEAVVIACDAAAVLAHRYADACRKKAETAPTEARREELLGMADGLDWIATEPARTFRESVQLQMLYITLLDLAGCGAISSCGRFDYTHGAFLEADLAAGRITIEYAQEIVDNFVLDISRTYGGVSPVFAKILGVGNTYMHTTVGGTDPETGKDSTNTCTFLVLEAVGRMGLHDPTVSLRLTRNSPPEILECAIETTKRVGGLPLYYNDEVLIPAVQKELGCTLEEARNYALIGCQELTIMGCDYACCNGISIPHGSCYYPVIMDMALNDGCNPMNKEQSEIHTGFLYEMENMEQVKEAYIKMARYVMDRYAAINCFCEYVIAWELPQVFLSIFFEGCMEKGKDIVQGGAKYTEFGGTATGLATVADSLCTIEYACFDKKICTTRELYDAFMADWVGYEELQQRLIAEVPHFGNGDPYADKWMTFATHSYYDLCMELSSKYAKYYRAGLYGASDHVGQGYVTWATPDGRKAGTPIADAASPCAGRDLNGPTAVLNSSVCYDHGKFMNGVCLNLRFHPKALEREDGNAKLASLIRSYMDQGGAEVQFNIVSAETMRAAQATPEEYRDLVVRIAGYSAYFVELSHDCQESLIARTENNL